jgi:hypothetical protein|tara:strand:+ start:635 stop:1165 length:531 start_codon:yes stop_codon:yes gene_type:complete
MKIIDGLLNKDELKALQDLLLGYEFPWYFNDNTIQEGKNVLNDFQLIHAFYLDGKNFGFIHSEFFKFIEPILEKIGCKILIRAKANLRTVAPEKDMVVGYHTDDQARNFALAYGITETAVFYVNTNNGYTIFKDGRKVDCIENRLVTFPTDIEHCGVSCTDSKQRVVINFNYIKGA